jgi:hypothetical protein
MKPIACRILLCIVFLLPFTIIYGQDSTYSVGLSNASSIFLTTVNSKAEKLEKKTASETQKTIRRFKKQEEKIRKQLTPTEATKIFGNAHEKYDELEKSLTTPSSLPQYIPSLDTAKTFVKLLQLHPQIVHDDNALQKVTDALNRLNGLDKELLKAEELKKFVTERKQYLREQLNNLGFAKELKKLDKQVFYYTQQINEYKLMLKDYKKAARKALDLLSQTKLFKEFMRKNSQLASLFRAPGGIDDLTAQPDLAGLQTRAQVNGMIQQQFAASGPNATAQFQQNMETAQKELDKLKNKMSQLGASSSDIEMPEGFRPNYQKKKTFLQRLEIGANIQSQKASSFFPVTSDLGLSLGYKLNDKGIVGVGASYKMGWGRDIRNISISSQGIGLRSFIDWKLKGSFWITGGYEINRRNEFTNIDQLRDLSLWQRSGLLGISKVVSLKTKLLKRTKLQLLWDLLSYQQLPRTRALLFRIGYGF